MEPDVRRDQTVRLVVERIKSSDKIAILEHEKPDGDCVGSGLALVQALRWLGKKALLVSQDPHPQVYDFLAGRTYYIRADYIEPKDFVPELAIFLDCTGPERAGKALELVEDRPWINIDHHISNSYFGEVNLVDPEASATGELVFEVIEALEIPWTVAMAEAIYVAIVTDTGGFRYQNTTSKALRLGARLLDMGVKAWEVSDLVFEQRTLSSLVLLALALDTLRIYHRGRIAAISVTREMVKNAGASPEESDGIINYPRSIQGVEVAVAFKEIENQKVHVSFRSRSRVDVAEIASSLGGGGHPRAAGVVLPGPIQDVQKKVIEMLVGLDVWTDS